MCDKLEICHALSAYPLGVRVRPVMQQHGAAGWHSSLAQALERERGCPWRNVIMLLDRHILSPLVVIRVSYNALRRYNRGNCTLYQGSLVRVNNDYEV